MASDLDLIGLAGHWAYHRASGWPVYYEPDFSLSRGPCHTHECSFCSDLSFHGEHLRLPQWIEVKPPDLLYAIRDELHLEQRFRGDHAYGASAEWLDYVTDGELGKPRRLAEASGEQVLVVSRVNAHETLSILVEPDGITLSRSHPLVNYRKFLQRCAEWIRAVEWSTREHERRARLESEWVAREEGREGERRRVRQQVLTGRSLPARYAGVCRLCGWRLEAADLEVVKVDEKWHAICGGCRADIIANPTP